MRSSLLAPLLILCLGRPAAAQLGQAPEVNPNTNNIPIVSFSVSSVHPTHNSTHIHNSDLLCSWTDMPARSPGHTSMAP